MSKLGPQALEALAAVAIADPVPPAVLAVMVDEEPVRQLQRLGLCRIEHDAEWSAIRLVHPLYGQPALAAVRPATVARLRSAYATTVAATSPSGPVGQVRVAVARLDAGEVLCDDELISAARAATALADGRLTERFARAVVEPSPDQLAVLADALILLGRDSEAADLLAGPTSVAGPAALQLSLVRIRALVRAGRADEANALLDGIAEQALEVDIARLNSMVNRHRYTDVVDIFERRVAPVLLDWLERGPSPDDPLLPVGMVIGIVRATSELGRPALQSGLP